MFIISTETEPALPDKESRMLSRMHPGAIGDLSHPDTVVGWRLGLGLGQVGACSCAETKMTGDSESKEVINWQGVGWIGWKLLTIMVRSISF